MEKTLRAQFNAAWSPALFDRLRSGLELRLGCPVEFPLAETPLFLPEETWTRLESAAREIVEELGNQGFLAAQESCVPERYRSPGMGPLPQFAQLDFAIVREADGSLGVRLVELQGFPSLYGFQTVLAESWSEVLQSVPGLSGGWSAFCPPEREAALRGLLREAIVGGHDPEEVVLLDLDPPHQKTYPDFAAVRNLFGVEPVCATRLLRRGNRLFRLRDGRTVPVLRIFQRVVFDEVEAREKQGLSLPFSFGEPLEVEWAPHPAWYFLWSKSALPRLHHPSVPATRRLSELSETPADPAQFVLKPLYSFAGSGVKVAPTAADLAAVPESRRGDFVLQERVEYAPALRTPEGAGVKAEVRMMFLRPDGDARMTLALNLVRLSRGPMMGVDFNQGLTWVGSSVGLRREGRKS